MQNNKIQLVRQKVLIIKLQYVGDTLGIVPVVAALKRHAPELTVDVLIHKKCAELIAHHADIRKVWVYDRSETQKSFSLTVAYHLPLLRNLRREKYDIVIALTQGDRAFFISFATGAPLRLTYKVNSIATKIMNAFTDQITERRHFIELDVDILSYFGIETREIELNIPIPEDLRTRMYNRLNLAATSGDPIVAIHPGARKKMRQWKPERFAQIAARIRNDAGASIVLLGGPGEKKLIGDIEQRMGFPAALTSCDLSLLEMAAVFAQCNLFIGNDSGPGHIAAAVGCPTLSLFGPNFPDICRPYIATGKVIFKNLACCGCRQEEHLCVRLENTCMDLIEADEVWQVVQKMIEGH